MSKRLKELSEKRGAKLEEAKALFTAAESEKRDLTSEELEKVNKIHDERDAIEAQINAEVRQISAQGYKPVELSREERRDVERFDFAKLLRSKASGTVIDGIEREMLEEGDREARDSGVPRKSGFYLPKMVTRYDAIRRETRDMTATGGTGGNQGGMTIATGKGGFYDAFHDALVLANNGATVLSDLVGNLDLPRMVSGTAPSGKAENSTSDEVSPATAQLSLTPNRLPAFIDISEQLLAQSSTNLEAWVRREIQAQMAAVAEGQYINGSGTNAAEGILQTTGIGSVIGGTNGANPDWADIIDLETEVSVDNAAVGNLYYITNAKVRGYLKKTVRVSSTDSRFIWEGSDLNGYTPLVTNAVPDNLTKGTVNTCSAIIFGNVQDYVIANWGMLNFELIRDTTNAKTGLYTLAVTMWHDGGVVRPVSFSAMKDALTV